MTVNGFNDVKATHGGDSLDLVVLAMNIDTATDGNDYALVTSSNRPY